MKRVVIVTGSRSEYGLLLPVIRRVEATPDLAVRVIVTGVHLLEEYGHTASEVHEQLGELVLEVPFYGDGPISDNSLASAIGAGTAAIGEALRDLESDVVVVLGDRAEALAAALAGYASHRVVAHIHGGERTHSGHIDEGFRHAITRIAHLHFAASAESARRLLETGEESWRVHETGSPGIDTAMEVAGGEDPAVRARYQLPGCGPFALFVFHPDRLSRDRAGQTAELILRELEARGLPTLALYPNSDEGSSQIIEAIRNAEKRNMALVVRESIPRREFLALQNEAALLIGNSSAGTIESSCFGLPVVNVGERNRDREHGDNVIFVAAQACEIESGVERALDGEFRLRCADCPCPYGDGHAAERIASILASTELDTAIYRKQLVI